MYAILFWFGMGSILLIVLGLLWIVCNYGTINWRKTERRWARINLKSWTLG